MWVALSYRYWLAGLETLVTNLVTFCVLSDISLVHAHAVFFRDVVQRRRGRWEGEGVIVLPVL